MNALSYYLHNLDPLIFRVWGEIGPRWYGLAYVLAFIGGYILLGWLSKRGYADLPRAQVGDFICWAALFGVMLGGRLGYAFFYKPEMLRDPVSLLRVWEGGMSSHGGMIGLVLFTFYYARRHKLSYMNLGDNLVVVAPIGLFFGRCANFINGELYGRPSNLPWAVQFPKELLERENVETVDRAVAACQKIAPNLDTPEAILQALPTNPQVEAALRTVLTPRHPSQLYEALLEGVVLFAILWIVRTRFRVPNGILAGLFLCCYAILRIIAENYREPDAGMIGIMTRGQFFSLFLFLIGVAFIFAAKKWPSYPKKIGRGD